MKKFLILLVSMVLLFGCMPEEPKSKTNYVPVDRSNQHGTVEIPRAYVIGVDRGNYIIQRFDYEGKTYLLYRENIIQVR